MTSEMDRAHLLHEAFIARSDRLTRAQVALITVRRDPQFRFLAPPAQAAVETAVRRLPWVECPSCHSRCREDEITSAGVCLGCDDRRVRIVEDRPA